MNETLLVLNLNGNKICNQGALAIAGSLQVNTILQELDMADTDMVRKLLLAIYLVMFDIQQTRLSVFEIDQLTYSYGTVEAICCSKKLLTCVMNFLQGTESFVAIATVLNYNNSLKVLNINRPIIHSSQVILSLLMFKY